jgi:hypothetical protein
MDVLTFETCWVVNSEIIKQVTPSWSVFIQLAQNKFRLSREKKCWKMSVFTTKTTTKYGKVLFKSRLFFQRRNFNIFLIRCQLKECLPFFLAFQYHSDNIHNLSRLLTLSMATARLTSLDVVIFQFVGVADQWEHREVLSSNPIREGLPGTSV